MKMALGLGEQLPRERSEECEESEGLGDAEEVLEDTLRFAGSFGHKGVSPCDAREITALRKERRAREGGILEALRRNATTTDNVQASEIGGGLAGVGSETKGARRNRRAKTKKRSGAAPPQRHGNGGSGQQPAPP